MPSPPVATIDATGLHLPTFDEGLTYFQSAFRGIYGDDVVLEPSTQDGQFMVLLATALTSVNASLAATYNAYSPATAQGVGLSSLVKINGIARKTPGYSTVDLVIVGQVGATLIDGVVTDEMGVRWNLPTTVTIPPEGEITVTATASTIGAIKAPANTVNRFATVQQGFQEVNNPVAATPGDPVEVDDQLRRRQALSTALPSTTILEGLLGAVLAVSGVARARIYENDTNVLDTASGMPAHTLALIVEGGDATTLARIIAAKKPPGVGTYGDTLVVITDAYGVDHPIRFHRPLYVNSAVKVTLRAFAGYTVDVANAIRTAIANHINLLGIGNPLLLRRLYVPANIPSDPRRETFEILDMRVSRYDTTSDQYGDVTVKFNEALTCAPADVLIEVVP